jgi:Zn-dependent peptidase ImmA (M78 family)
MSQSDITAPILSYDDINKQAEGFLREYKRNEILPVDIEAIAEFDLGLNIFPFPNLLQTFDVDGFISGDLNIIYVDEFSYYQRPARYRFTLAHEIGHYVLHSELIASFHPQSVADWSKFVLEIDEETYGWLEWQAYTFAAAVLVPRISLRQNFSRELKLLQPKLDLIRSRGLSVESSQDYIVNAISTKLIGIYDVSDDVLNRRISKELEKGYLSLE